MLARLLKPMIEDAILNKNFRALRDGLVGVPSQDLADLLEEIEEPNRSIVFRLLPRDLMTNVFDTFSTMIYWCRFSFASTSMISSDSEKRTLTSKAVRTSSLSYPENDSGCVVILPEGMTVKFFSQLMKNKINPATGIVSADLFMA